LNLTQQDTDDLTAGWIETITSVNEKVNAAGGPQFTTVTTPSNDTAQCISFFKSACGTQGVSQIV